MKPLFLYLTLATAGIVIYHLGQKSLPPSGNPMILLMAVYLGAFLCCAASAPFFGPASLAGQGGRLLPSLRLLLGWPLFAVALGAFFIELGFLMAYRHGGAVQWSGVAVNAAAGLILLPLAALLFKEQLSPGRILGVLFSLAGLVLLARK